MIIYELWHSRSNNMVATFDSEAETLRALAAMFEDEVTALEDYELTWDDVDQDAGDDADDARPGGFVAQGAALVEIVSGGAFPALVNVCAEQS